MVDILKQMKFKLTRKPLEKIYFSFITPTLEYRDVVWQGASHCHLCKIDSVHVAAMRLVSGAPYRSNTQSLYTELGWQNLHERRQQHTLIMMYKILNNHTPD